MTLLRFTLAAAISCGMLAAGGCATLSEGQCYTVDWYELGNRDGSNGMARTRLNQHYQACAEYGIRPQPDAYDAGREAGLERYCTPRSGFEEGRAGRTYHGVCPPRLEADFFTGYRQGEALYDLDTDIDDVQDAIRRTRQRLNADDMSHRQRRLLRRELNSLTRELRYLERERLRRQRRSVHAL